MYSSKLIAVVIPCYNEESQISRVIKTMPGFIDKLIVIDDVSKDKTIDVVEKLMKENNRLVLIKHTKNQGVGGAIASGYKWARDNNMDAVVVMAGDGQMNPDDLPQLLDPVVKGEVDYSKANRLFTGEAFKKIPKIRYFGNSILSMFTKIASGYWHVADSQSGYTVINKEALQAIDWDLMYKRYGQPNDLLVKLNVNNFRVRDIHLIPVYGVGEKSNIRIGKVIFTIGYLLLKSFLWRLKEKYIIRDFHPLIFFYFLGLLFFVLFILLFVNTILGWIKTGDVPPISALGMMFSFMSCSMFTLFAMWFDMESNKHLK